MSTKKKGGRPKEKKEKSEEPEPSGSGEPGSWECTLCTYRNKFESFKCEMCDTRKGTSTRKPRLNQDVQQHHSAVHNFVLHQHQKLPGVPRLRKGGVLRESAGSPSTSRHSPESTSSGSAPRPGPPPAGSINIKKRKPVPIPDSLIVRSSPKKMTVSAGGVSVQITEFRARKPFACSAE